MKKQTRSGAASTTKNSQAKSFINVKMFEPVSKKFTISRESDSLLSDYLQYLSSSSGRKYNEDSVVEALIEKLNEDKSFLTWLSSKNINIPKETHKTDSEINS
jgi:hypothetical protein